jgi:hypothetical protein
VFHSSGAILQLLGLRTFLRQQLNCLLEGHLRVIITRLVRLTLHRLRTITSNVQRWGRRTQLTLGAILRAAEQKGKAGVVMEFLVALAELSEAVQAQVVQSFKLSDQILTDREKFMDCLQHMESYEAAKEQPRSWE